MTFYPIENYCKLSFDKYQMYQIETVLDNNFSFFIEDDAKDSFDMLKSIESKSIENNDLIYFSKNVEYPKLLLNQLNINIKRTIKLDKANKIIIKSSLHKLIQNTSITTGYFVKKDNDSLFIEFDNLNNIPLNKAKLFFGGDWTSVVKTDKCLNIEDLNFLLKNKDRVVFFDDFIYTINNKLPKLDNNQKECILSMIKSTDEQQQKLGINMLVGYDLSSVIIDLFSTLFIDSKTKLSSDVCNSIQFKYLMSFFNNGYLSLYNYLHYKYDYKKIALNTLVELYNSKLPSQEQKDKIPYIIKNTEKIYYYNFYGSETYKNFCINNNMPIIDD